MRVLSTILLVLASSLAFAQKGLLQGSSVSDTFLENQVKREFEDPQKVKIAELQKLMTTLYENNQFNGSVLVKQEGQVIYKKAFGWANFEDKDTMTTDTPVRLASVSKQFTAMAIMILKEQGKLNYDDKITKYLPNLPYKYVTIRNLLNHNSGIPDYFGLGWGISAFYGKKYLIDNEDIVKYFALKRPALQFRTGKKAAYSNTGYIFLASIVEKISGEAFSVFLDNNIFKPLHMDKTFVYNTRNFESQVTQDTVLVSQDTIISGYNEIRIRTNFKTETIIKNVKRRRAIGYAHSAKKPYQVLDFHKFDGIAGEKSVCTTVEDLSKWDDALYTNDLVSQKTLKEAFKPHAVTNKKGYKYGFGWKVYTKWDRVVFHHGLYRGFRNYFQRDLNNKNTVIILCNRQNGRQIVSILEAVNDILYDKKSYKLPKPAKYEKDSYAEFISKYRINYRK